MTTPAKSTSAKCVCEFQSIADANPVCGSEYAGNINGSYCYNQLPGGSYCGHDAACHAAASEPATVHVTHHFDDRTLTGLFTIPATTSEPMVSLKLGVAMRLLGMLHERDHGDEQARIALEDEIARASTQPQDDSEGR